MDYATKVMGGSKAGMGTNLGANGANGEWDHLGKSYDPALAAEFNYTRNRGTDTEHERTAIGRTQDKMKSLLTEQVMEQVMQDKMLKAGVQQAVDDAWHYKPEKEATSEDEEDPLDEDADFAFLRQKRLAALKARKQKHAELKAKGHGDYDEITQDEFLPKVCASMHVVCHFYHKNFERCKIMDMHLRKLAPKCFGTKFLTINAEKSPFFVEKLRVQMLPTVIFFTDGIATHSMAGFEELGNTDEFSSSKLARLMYMHEVVEEHFDSDDEDLL